MQSPIRIKLPTGHRCSRTLTRYGMKANMMGRAASTGTSGNSHCRGAVFLNGGAIETPELLRSIDTISATYDGFYFGRYDIRTPSVDEFQAGRNFKIVELNGVTSEVTHIYQPGSSLRNAYRDLRRQWRIAYEIGARNIENGAVPTKIRTLLAMTAKFKETRHWREAPSSIHNPL